MRGPHQPSRTTAEWCSDAVFFFSGRHADLRRRFEREMREASQRLEYERAARLRDNLAALDQISERVRVRAVQAADLALPLAASRSVTDLQAALGLAAAPFHVECFDISHFQGRQIVAAMVCFLGGGPARTTTAGSGSATSRHRRLHSPCRGRVAPLQPPAAGRRGLARPHPHRRRQGPAGRRPEALGELKLKIPSAALAKRIEEVFLPGRPSRSSWIGAGRPELLQRLRDEAHRFGITYHRLLRDKELLGSKVPPHTADPFLLTGVGLASQPVPAFGP